MIPLRVVVKRSPQLVPVDMSAWPRCPTCGVVFWPARALARHALLRHCGGCAKRRRERARILREGAVRIITTRTPSIAQVHRVPGSCPPASMNTEGGSIA